MLIGAAAARILFPARSKPDAADEEDENARRQRLATEHDTAASAGFRTALDACRGLPTRLTRIAEAAEAKASALRDAHEAGLVAAPHRVSPDWRPPWELQRDSPRLPVIAWQLLDRAFDQLTATLDDPDTDLASTASAYDQLGKAAREVAKQLHNDDGQRELKQRTRPLLVLRQARARDVRKIITGPTSAICNECGGLGCPPSPPPPSPLRRGSLDEEHGDD